MMHFTVEDHSAVDAACQKCCCEKLNLKPGTTSKVSIGYAPWALPIGQLHCSPQFSIEPLDTCLVPTPVNQPPSSSVGSPIINTAVDTAVTESLVNWITDPEGLPLTFKEMPFYGTKHGKLVLATDGAFTYTPTLNYKGQDSVFITASDGVNNAVFEVLFAVGIGANQVVPTPHISVGAAVVDQRYFTVYFPVTLSPAAQLCELWRLSVHQMALDCNCICFSRTDCFDIGVAQC